jgi:hypothetical protein
MTVVWLLGTYSPRFHIVGVYTNRLAALEAIGAAPKTGEYVLFQAPVNVFFGFVDKNGQIQDGMGGLSHEHFTAEADS